MNKIILFELSGKFAHFMFPFTHPKYLKKSFYIPPKTTILGILGAILGLKGFQEYDDEKYPEYYEKLKDIPISISLGILPIKRLVKYNSLNSFAKNIKKDPNVIMSEEILLNPCYEIGLVLNLDREIDKKILEAFSKERLSSKYPIYLGKNEFFANIKNVRIFDEKDFAIEYRSSVRRLNSIFPLELQNEENPPEKLTLDAFSKDIDFSEKKLKTKLIPIGYFLKESRDYEIEFKKDVKLYKIIDSYYYFFENE